MSTDPGDRPHVHLFTDGACSGNPGPGGWAFILRHIKSSIEKERSGGHPRTTNNRMELTSVIEGLKSLNRPSKVDLYSDSKYVIDGLRSWLDQWIARGWKTASKKAVLNADLWRQLDDLRQTHAISYHWVRGHANHPENTRVDRLAVQAIEQHRHDRVSSDSCDGGGLPDADDGS
jgi:ribonuclease HI